MSRPKGSPESSRVGTPEEQEIDPAGEDSSTSVGMTAGTSTNQTTATEIARGQIDALRSRLTVEANQRRDDAARDAIRAGKPQAIEEADKAKEEADKAKEEADKAKEEADQAKKKEKDANDRLALAAASEEDAMIVIRGAEVEKRLLNLPGATDLLQFLSLNPRILELFRDYCKNPDGINWDLKAEQYTVAITTKLRGILDRLNPTASGSKRKSTAGFSGGYKQPRR